MILPKKRKKCQPLLLTRPMVLFIFMNKEKNPPEEGPFFGTTGPFGTGKKIMGGLTPEDLKRLIETYGKNAKVTDVITSEILKKDKRQN